MSCASRVSHDGDGIVAASLVSPRVARAASGRGGAGGCGGGFDLVAWRCACPWCAAHGAAATDRTRPAAAIDARHDRAGEGIARRAPVQRDEAMRTLESALQQRMAGRSQISRSGDRVTVTLSGVATGAGAMAGSGPRRFAGVGAAGALDAFADRVEWQYRAATAPRMSPFAVSASTRKRPQGPGVVSQHA